MAEPLYKMVFNAVVSRIAEGTYVAGSMLPNEFDLADELGVSQGTARKALIELELKGIIERRQGKGSFVTLRTPENSLFHFFRLRGPDGAQVTPSLETESVLRRKATDNEKSILFGQPTDVFEINRVRYFEKSPLCVEQSVVPTALFPGLPERQPLTNALYVFFQQAYAIIVISASEHLVAEALNETKAAKLETDVGTAALTIERHTQDLLERTVEIRHSTYLTRGLSYFVELN